MAVSQQLLHYQLSLAHTVCQQLPADSRIRHRITQLLEVALDLATCADTPLGPWQQWGHSPATPAPASHSAWPAQTFPAAANPWPQHTAATATATTASRRYRQCKRREGLYGKRACHSARDSQQQGNQQQEGPQQSSEQQGTQQQDRQQQDGQQHSSQQQDSSQQHGPADPPTPSTSHPAEPQASPTESPTTSTCLPTAPQATTIPSVGFSVHAAWVHGIAGLSQQEVGALVAAVRGLSSCYGPVQTAAAVKLQGITAHSPNPEAVAEALLELDAIQDLTALLTSGSTSCKAAAAATLCNIAWYDPPRSSMLAAGTIPMLSALLWDDDQTCRMEAACGLSALTSSHDEAVCSAVKAAGGIPRLVGLLEPPGSSDGSNGGVDDGSSGLNGSKMGLLGVPSNSDGSNGSSNDGVDGSSVGLLGVPDSSDGSNGRVDGTSSGVDGSSAGLLGVPGSSDGSNVGVDGSSNGGVGGSSAQQLGVPGSKDTNNSDNSSGPGADSSSGSHLPASCIKTNGDAVCIGDNNTAANDPNSDPAAAPAPDACAALTSAAVTVLGNLAASSALIATTSGALLAMVACLSSTDCSCRVAALQALLHITAGEQWRLANGLVLAQVKAAGAIDAMFDLAHLTPSAVGSLEGQQVDEKWQALQLWTRLHWPVPPQIGDA